MEARIEILNDKKLAGKRLRMSLRNNRTKELWQDFMPERHKIKNALGKDLFSLQVYDKAYFHNFDPNNEFEKWALVEVAGSEPIPEGMEVFELKGGLYAVFFYKGASSKGAEIFQYIFGTWLPKSDYLLDGRPHFELLGEKYKNDDPESEEEIWIPIRPKE